MYILSQDRKVIVNTELMDAVYTRYGDSVEKDVRFMAIGDTDSWTTLGIYHSGERANEVLQHIFRALKNKEVTFEMPEV